MIQLGNAIKNSETNEVAHQYVLSKWDNADMHNHEGGTPKIIADRIMMEMIKQVEVIFIHLFKYFFLILTH